MGKLARKTEHSTTRGDVRAWQLRRAAILLPRREKKGNRLTAVLEQATFPAESLTEKKADIGVAKTPKILLDVDV